MKNKYTNNLMALTAGAISATFPTVSFAYLGPGAGLGMIGSLIAIVVVALIVVLGLVVYPIRLMRKRRAKARGSADDTSTPG